MDLRKRQKYFLSSEFNMDLRKRQTNFLIQIETNLTSEQTDMVKELIRRHKGALSKKRKLDDDPYTLTVR